MCMCCHPYGRKGLETHPGWDYGCCMVPSHFHRHFLTEDERIAMLEKYRTDLKNELTAVEAALKELKKK